MHDPRIDQIADVLVSYSIGVTKGQKALINAPHAATELGKAVAIKVLEAGGLPIVRSIVPGLLELMYTHASDEQLAFVPQATLEYYKEADVTFNLMARENTSENTKISPERRKVFNDGMAKVREVMGCCSGEKPGVMTMFPTNAVAQQMGMSLLEYEEFYFAALLPDRDDPVAYWRRFGERQAQLVARLNAASEFRVLADGTDLSFRTDDREFVNESGRGNLPGGEVYVGPVEGSANGKIAFTYSTRSRGQKIEGIRLEVEDGRVVRATADVNEPTLIEILDTDEGSRNIGEFALGTNEGITSFIGDTLFDEKMAGTFHVALGAGIAGNKVKSAIHRDIVSDLRGGGRVYADGELIYEDGRFLA